MADRNALTAGGIDLQAFSLGDADILVDVTSSLFGDAEKIAARLPTVIDDRHDPLGSVANRAEAAFFEVTGEEIQGPFAALAAAATSSEDDAPSQILGGVPPALPVASLASSATASFLPAYSLALEQPEPMHPTSHGAEAEASGIVAAGESDAGAHAHPFYDSAPSHGSTEPSDFKTGGGKWGPSGAYGTTGGTVTWSIADAGWSNGSPASNWFSGTTVALSSFLSFDFTGVLTQAFAAWSAVANINFVQVADGGGNLGAGPTAMIRLGGAFIDGRPSSGSILASAFFPATAGNPQAYAYSGDVVFDSAEPGFWTSTSFLAVATHEIGHSLGLDHTTVPNSLMNAFYNPSITTPQADDIAGIRFIYGAPPPPPPPPPSQPLITFGGGGDNAAIGFGENAKLVGIVTASNALSYSITGGADAGKFQIDGGTGALSFLAAPNFEAPTDTGANNSYVVQVRAANGSLFDTQTITVNVLNLAERPTNDHNADLRSDLLWTHDSGQLAIWDMSGSQQSGYHFLGFVDATWKVAKTGDFNGDAHTDVLWRHEGGSVAVWDIVNSQQAGYHFVASVGNDWHVVDANDFNGDRTSDLLWSHDSGQLAIWDMNGGQ
jgi:Matrixin